MGARSVSVIIPAYNAETYIRAAIASALSQTKPAQEIVVVDDGSTDGTAAVVRSFGNRVRHHYQTNAKQAAARNAGCRLAQGELLAFLDADDEWRRDKLEKQLDLLARKPSLGLVYSSLEEMDSLGNRGSLRHATLRGKPYRDVLLGHGGHGLAQGSTALVTREVWAAVGGYQEDLSPCEDTDFAWRVAARFGIDFVDEPLVRYRLHAANSHRNVEATTRAWMLLYNRALQDPLVQSSGRLFRARCRGRLFYMLAGDHARAARWGSALGYAVRLSLVWPPGLLRLVYRLARRLGPGGE